MTVLFYELWFLKCSCLFIPCRFHLVLNFILNLFVGLKINIQAEITHSVVPSRKMEYKQPSFSSGQSAAHFLLFVAYMIIRRK